MFDALAELPGVVALLQVVSVLLGMARQSKEDKEGTKCKERLNYCEVKLKESEEEREKAERERDVYRYVLIAVLVAVVLVSINYRMVPRSLSA